MRTRGGQTSRGLPPRFSISKSYLTSSDLTVTAQLL